MDEISKSKTTPFSTTIEKKVYKEDKDFIGKILKLDWRDRPTAKELLQDKLFEDGGL